MRRIIGGLLLIGALIHGANVLRNDPSKLPAPKEPDVARPKRKPLLPRNEYEKAQIGGPISPDGSVEVDTDLPVSLRTKNVGGSDGAGLCVFSSIGHAARYQNEPTLRDFQKWMRQHPGGGTPSKVDKMIAKLCKEANVEPPSYINYQGNDVSLIKAALKTGRMPSVTYNGNHMVNCIYLDDKWCAILDNNYVGENEIRWYTPQEFQKLYTMGGGGWTVVLLHPGPPPPPHNGTASVPPSAPIKGLK